MCNTAIILPFNGNSERWEQAQFVESYYQTTFPGIETVYGWDDSPVWCKGKAIANGLLKTDAEVLAIIDADLLVNPELLTEAIWQAFDTGQLVIPFNRVLNLSPDGEVERIRERFYWAGGCWVIRRDVYESVGGVDTRFKGWGGEDESFCNAIYTLIGPLIILPGDAWHLWHSDNPVKRQWKRTPNYILWQRYRAAKCKPEKMRDLVEG